MGASSVYCAGCGYDAPADDPYPFRCPNAGRGDDVDHVMTRSLDLDRLSLPRDDDEANPFVRYRTLFHSYHLARSRGMSDEDFVDLVRRLDKEVTGVDGRGFVVTPLERSDGLGERLMPQGGLWVKDETRNVSGSHKARHLMGLLIHLEVVERLGLAPSGPPPDLAIASCGNAALAAAVVASAGDRKLQVFVPTWADRSVVRRLEGLGARINVAEREDGVPGDPTYHALQRAIAGGAIPFTCQGNENGLAIEGGQTIGYEIASQLGAGGATLDRLFVQVGGGALASAVIQGLREAVAMGALPRMPRIHAVQTEGGFPLKRAYDRVAGRAVEGLHPRIAPGTEADRADFLAARFRSPAVQEALRDAASHRSQFMWPWEEEPKSVAQGILDDETYDWLAVTTGMMQTGGFPVVVSEDSLERANQLATTATGIDVDHTGSSGLAGLIALQEDGLIRGDEEVGVLFTGIRR